MITWLASYPKSGNTWVRAFLAAYAFADDFDGEFDLNAVPRISDSESRGTWFAEVAGKPFPSLSPPEIDACREAVQQRLAWSLGPRRVVKTHNARAMHRGTPLIRRELTRRAVYLVRNPLDIVDSLADHDGFGTDEAIALMANRRHTLGGPAFADAPQFLDSWSQHVKSWIAHRAFPVEVIRYEDLLTDPHSNFVRLLRFLNWEVDERRLGWALQQTSFQAMQAKEAQNSFVETSHASRSGRFFRRGKMGAWREVLTPEQAHRVVQDHGAVMSMLGYEIPNLSTSSSAKQDENRQALSSVSTEWQEWIAENLLLGLPGEQLIRVLVEKGFAEPVSREEVATADAHPYLRAARKLKSGAFRPECSPTAPNAGIELSSPR